MSACTSASTQVWQLIISITEQQVFMWWGYYGLSHVYIRKPPKAAAVNLTNLTIDGSHVVVGNVFVVSESNNVCCKFHFIVSTTRQGWIKCVGNISFKKLDQFLEQVFKCIECVCLKCSVSAKESSSKKFLYKYKIYTYKMTAAKYWNLK